MADTNQLRTLSIRQIMDSSDYARGAREFVSANREMSQSSAIVGQIVTQTQVKISNAADGVTRLVRAYDPAAAAAVKFQSELVALNNQMQNGKLTADEAGRVYAGMVQKFGMAADGADILAQGFRSLGTVVSATNQEMAEFARVSAAIESATQELEQMTAAATRLRAEIDPIGASQGRLNAQLAEYSSLLRAGAISELEFAKGADLARQKHEAFAASLDRSPIGANDNNAAFRRSNLGYQLFDVGQSAALGFSPAMILAQQGPQIAQLYAMQGGVKAAFSDVRALASGAISALGPVGLAFTAVTAAAGAFYFLTHKETKTNEELLKDHAATIKALGDAYDIATSRAKIYSETDKAIAAASERKSGEALQERKTISVEDFYLQYTRPVTSLDPKTGDQRFSREAAANKAFTDAFNALRNSGDVEKFIATIQKFGENDAFRKQADDVLEYAKELKVVNDALREHDRLQALVAGARQRGFIASDAQAQRDYEQGVTDDYLRRQKIVDDLAESQRKYNAQVQAISARSPQEKAAAASAAQEAIVTPGEDPRIRAERIELAGKQALLQAENELSLAQEDRQRQSQTALAQAQLELSIIGQSVAERNRLMAAYQAEAQIREAAARSHVAADEAEIASARKKAAAIADMSAQVSLGRAIEEQGYDAQRLQLEASLIGATVEQRARATAALEAEIRLKQQGIDLSSQAAQGYVAEQQALASARVEIERQQAAYQSLQQVQGSVIDDLMVGTGSLNDRLHSVGQTALQWLQQMSANGIKNWLTGTNLPTLGDLFSGRPAVPGASATSAAMMNVTASVVNLNGGLPGLPGTNTGGLGSLLGYNPAANNNTPANMLAYQNAIKSIESGGRYDIMGPVTASGDRAYGAYQVMGNNIPSWTEKYYGQRLTPDQFLASRQAQDAVFNGEFGASVNRYGAEGAAAKWFTGSPTIRGRSDILGTTDSQYVNQFNSALKNANANLAATSKDVSTLGQNSTDAGKSLLDAFKSPTSNLPALPQGQLPTNYFPPAPTSGGFNPLSFFTSIFSLFGFADGTDYSPGGYFPVGERGPELVNLPRGSRVIPNHKLHGLANDNGPRAVNHRHEYNIVVSGTGDKELETRLASVADTIARAHIENFVHNGFGDAVEDYRANPFSRG